MKIDIVYFSSLVKEYTQGFPYKNEKRSDFDMMIANKIALVFAIIGGINWGLVGLFSFDLVAWIAGGSTMLLARIIYILVALAIVWCISLLFGDAEGIESKV